MNMSIISKQRKQQFILNKLKNRHRFHLSLKKQQIFRKHKKLELVDWETEQRIGQALAEKGQGIIISSREELHSFLESISTNV